jgi:hypothetical protein
MITTTNHIPEQWEPFNKMAFLEWMIKIQSTTYSEI